MRQRREKPIDPIQADRAFLEGLYRRWRDLLYAHARSLGAGEAEAEDVLQESFLHLWEKVETLRGLPERRLFNYVYTTVHNAALSHLARRGRLPGLSLDDPALAVADRKPGPEEALLSLERERDFRAAMDRLEEGPRQLLILRYVLEAGDEEIAESLGVQKDSVRMLLTRARRKLREELKKLEEGGERK
ncbi:MAG: sigma-70 family RNA polymerase sigma factor [Oscillospiraceae bacterium]|nr:sigma-70 family RNA polymerase sigma factor [Oscillospiraceae bacterium]